MSGIFIESLEDLKKMKSEYVKTIGVQCISTLKKQGLLLTELEEQRGKTLTALFL